MGMSQACSIRDILGLNAAKEVSEYAPDSERPAQLWQCESLHCPAETAAGLSAVQIGAPHLSPSVQSDFHQQHSDQSMCSHRHARLLQQLGHARLDPACQ